MSQSIVPSYYTDIKGTLITMFMLKNTDTKSNNFFSMVYMMLLTSFIDLIIKYLPFIIQFLNQRYTNKMNEKINSMTTDIVDNKLKSKTGSIIFDIVVNDLQNIPSQAILDYITNHKNTIFVSYKKQNYILNQRDVISLEDDYYACMIEHITETNNETQKVEIYSFIHNTNDIRKFVDKLTYNYTLTMKNKLGNQRYFFNMNPYDTPLVMENKTIQKNDITETILVSNKDFSKLPPMFEFIMKPFQTNRLFTNLFGEKIDIIRERVKFFIKNKRWYDEKGIPYTLGILLSGPPGTGKTSTIKCIANETNRHIFNINLNHDITKKQLENLFFNENVLVSSEGIGNKPAHICIPLEQRIYVLEDIDCQSNLVLDREFNTNNVKSNDAIDLSFLLNLLDGVLENPGRIVIMTSNYPDRLDRALIRPGRIDIISCFDYCSHKTIIDMIEFFYDIKMNHQDKDKIKSLNEFNITPAELSKIMFENFGNYNNMFNDLSNYRLEIPEVTFLDSIKEENIVIETYDNIKDLETIVCNNEINKMLDSKYLENEENEIKEIKEENIVIEKYDNLLKQFETIIYNKDEINKMLDSKYLENEEENKKTLDELFRRELIDKIENEVKVYETNYELFYTIDY
jgi:ATP-dependent 26S proteasome regulatory subunit